MPRRQRKTRFSEYIIVFTVVRQIVAEGICCDKFCASGGTQEQGRLPTSEAQALSPQECCKSSEHSQHNVGMWKWRGPYLVQPGVILEGFLAEETFVLHLEDG